MLKVHVMHHYAKTVNFIHIAQKTEETTFKSGRGKEGTNFEGLQ